MFHRCLGPSSTRTPVTDTPSHGVPRIIRRPFHLMGHLRLHETTTPLALIEIESRYPMGWAWSLFLHVVSVASQNQWRGTEPAADCSLSADNQAERRGSSGTIRRPCATDTLSTLFFCCCSPVFYNKIQCNSIHRDDLSTSNNNVLFVFLIALSLYFSVRLEREMPKPTVVYWCPSVKQLQTPPPSKMRTAEGNGAKRGIDTVLGEQTTESNHNLTPFEGLHPAVKQEDTMSAERQTITPKDSQRRER